MKKIRQTKAELMKENETLKDSYKAAVAKLKEVEKLNLLLLSVLVEKLKREEASRYEGGESVTKETVMKLIEAGRKHADGHFTLFGFTPNVRARFDTPDLIGGSELPDPTNNDTYAEVEGMPFGKNVAEAVCLAVVELLDEILKR
jgi:hypothetical protein